MQAVILIGLQGSGKSTFYREKFSNTHVRISLDVLKTRSREMALVKQCLELRKNFVIENTNLALAERARYIVPARAAGYEIAGYFLGCKIKDCLKRNKDRKDRVPPGALFATWKKLVLPSFEEGFDSLFYVGIDPSGAFVVKPWREIGLEELSQHAFPRTY